MKRVVEKIGAFFGSPTLTVWLVGLFILYYLTLAVWVGEAFSRFVKQLSSDMVFQAFYLLFLLNVSLRIAAIVRRRQGGWAVVLLRLPLLVGVVLFLASFFLSLNVRQLSWSPPLGADDPLDLPWQHEEYRIVSVKPAIAKKALRTDDSAIFDYEPAIMIAGQDGTLQEIGAFPPSKVGKSFLHVLTFGLGPGVELRKGGNILWRGYVALRLVPFGVVDRFSLPPQPYQFSLSVVPNHTVRKGRETARTYELEQPRYLVEIVKGDRVLRREEAEGTVAFDGDMSISFFTPSDWVIIEAVQDFFLPWFATSLLLLLAGMLLYPFSFLAKNTGDDTPDQTRDLPPVV